MMDWDPIEEQIPGKYDNLRWDLTVLNIGKNLELLVPLVGHAQIHTLEKEIC